MHNVVSPEMLPANKLTSFLCTIDVWSSRGCEFVVDGKRVKGWKDYCVAEPMRDLAYAVAIGVAGGCEVASEAYQRLKMPSCSYAPHSCLPQASVEDKATRRTDSEE